MRHTWQETFSGLKRNLTMTIAVIVTMAVSLVLFGIGVLAAEQVNLFKDKWYDEVQVTVYLCSPTSPSASCDPGMEVTDAQRQAIEQALRDSPDVKEVYYESKAEAFENYLKIYEGSPYQGSLTEEDITSSLRVKLKDPEKYATVKSIVDGLKGVDNVQDMHKVLETTFRWLNLAKWATIVASSFLLLAAALQIINTIRMAAFARRRELGIMRLVGASNFYIILPFLMESLISGLISVLLSAVVMVGSVYFVIIRKISVSASTRAWIGWRETGVAVMWVFIVGVVLSIIPTLLATRKYLRV